MRYIIHRYAIRLNHTVVRNLNSFVKNPKLLDTVVTRDLSPHNLYESMILSQIPAWKGSRIESYKYDKKIHAKEIENLQALHDNWYPNDDSKVFTKKDKTFSGKYNEHTSFEVDLYFKSPESIENCAEFLQGCMTKLHTKSGKTEGPLTDKWVFIETTASPSLLLQKLFQLESAVRLLPLIDQKYKPEALCVLVNGNEKDADRAIDLVTIPENARIRQYPLYIGWVPTRNIYTTFRDFDKKLTDKMSSMETKMTSLDKELKNLDSRMTQLDSRMTQELNGLEKKIDNLAGLISQLVGKVEKKE